MYVLIFITMVLSACSTGTEKGQEVLVSEEQEIGLQDQEKPLTRVEKIYHHGPATWQYLEDGLEVIEIDSAIWVFKIDANVFKFSISKGEGLSEFWVGDDEMKYLPLWGRGINLNMFTGSYLPNGYTKVDGKVLQPKHNKAYNLYMVWNDDEFKILDRRVESIKEIANYPNVSQNIRMIKSGPGERNTWEVNQKSWSVSTLASTRDDKVLLIHTRTPYTMHDFIDVILENDSLLNVDRMVYLEGGPESSIHINDTYSRMGSYETGFNENDDNTFFWGLPFALTFQKK